VLRDSQDIICRSKNFGRTAGESAEDRDLRGGTKRVLEALLSRLFDQQFERL
jgi:hypothetical protein